MVYILVKKQRELIVLVFLFLFLIHVNPLKAFQDLSPCEELNRIDSTFNPSNAGKILQQVLALQGKILSDEKENCQVELNYLLGKIYYFQYQYNLSSYYYQRAIEILENGRKDPRMLKRLYNNLGVNLELMEQYEKAVENYFKSMFYEVLLGDSTGLYMSKINIGLAYTRLQLLDSALKFTQEAHLFFEKKSDWPNYYLAHQNLGIIAAALGENEASVKYLKDSYTYYRDLEDYTNAGSQLNPLIQSLIKSGKYNEAIKYLELLEEYVEKFPNPYVLASYKESLGDWLESQNRYSEAYEAYYEAANLYEKFSYSVNDLFILEKLLSLANRLRDDRKFNDILKRYSGKLNEKIKNDVGKTISEYSSIYQELLKEKEVSIRNLEMANELKTYQWIVGFLIILLLSLFGYFILRKRLKESVKQLLDSKGKIEELETKIQHLETDQFMVIYKQVLECIQQHFMDSSLNLESLTRMVGSNQTYVSKAINLHAGVGLPKLINQERVKFAKKLIIQGHDLEDVYNMAGFSSKSSFFRYFKEITGMTPKVYQESLVKKAGEGGE